MTENPRPEIVVAGGGIAALEFVLALRDLAGDRVNLTVVAPNREFVPPPQLVAHPLVGVAAQRRPLQRIADEAGFRLVPASVGAVAPERHQVALRGGGTVGYDTLVLAPGATVLPAFDDVIHIGDAQSTEALAA